MPNKLEKDNTNSVMPECENTLDITPAPQEDVIWPGFPCGTVGGLTSVGCLGKSYWSLEAAMCVASRPGNEALLQLDISKHGRVAVFFAEDPEEIVRFRMWHSAQMIDPADLREATVSFKFVNVYRSSNMNLQDSDFYESIIDQAQSARLIILDSFNRFFPDVDYNSSVDMLAAYDVLASIARDCDATVLITHHGEGWGSGMEVFLSRLSWHGLLEPVLLTEDDAELLGIAELTDESALMFTGRDGETGSLTAQSLLLRVEEGVLLGGKNA